jgi:hypothetical protein
MIKVYSNNVLRKIEKHGGDLEFSDSIINFNKLTNNQFQDENIVAVGNSEDGVITTAYIKDFKIDINRPSEFFTAVKHNSSNDEVFYKTYHKGNCSGVDINKLPLDLPSDAKVFATGLYSNSESIVTLYFSSIDADNLDVYEDIGATNFHAATLIPDTKEILISEYLHVPS